MLPNKKAESMFFSILFHIIILSIFTALMLTVIAQMKNNAFFWEVVFIKEITKTIDASQPSDSICLNVNKAIEVAGKNEISNSDIFTINNLDNELCIKLSKGKSSCLYHFSEIDLINQDLILGEKVDTEGNVINLFCFDIIKAREEVAIN